MGSSIFKQANVGTQTQDSYIKSNTKPEEIFINDLISSNEVVIFSRNNCGFCTRAKSELKSINKEFYSIELDDHKKCPGEDCTKVIQSLMLQTRMKTVPQIFWNGELIGGYTELQEMISSGKLK